MTNTPSDGTYSKLAEIARRTGSVKRPPDSSAAADEEHSNGLAATPYISMSYRFTDDEIRWLRRQAYDLTEALGTKVTQNAVLRAALQLLRKACASDPDHNPLTDAFPLLKK